MVSKSADNMYVTNLSDTVLLVVQAGNTNCAPQSAPMHLEVSSDYFALPFNLRPRYSITLKTCFLKRIGSKCV
eukprot:3002886-Pyramimonas_sp.AAC.1